MKLSEIPPRVPVYLDVWILLGAIVAAKAGRYAPHSQDCYDLMQFCRSRQIPGVTTTLTILRAWKLLSALAMQKHGSHVETSLRNVFIKGKADPVVDEANRRIRDLAESSLTIIPVEAEDFKFGTELHSNIGLDFDSALSIAAIQRSFGWEFCIATTTPKVFEDFVYGAGLTMWVPKDFSVGGT